MVADLHSSNAAGPGGTGSAILTTMSKRSWLVVGGLAAIAIVGWFKFRGGDARSAPTPAAANSKDPPTQLASAGGGATERPTIEVAKALPPPQQWSDKRYPGVTFMAVEEAKPDPVREAEERLLYSKRRLRFALSDAAAECYSGPDDKADIELKYTLIVENEILRVEDLEMVDSNLPSVELEQCIMQQIRDLRSSAAEIPDLREAGSSYISLHDLYVRNKPRE